MTLEQLKSAIPVMVELGVKEVTIKVEHLAELVNGDMEDVESDTSENPSETETPIGYFVK